MKDMSWKDALVGPDRDLAIEAFNKELNSLLDEILVPIPKDHPDRKEAEKLATAGRALLDYKRCGTCIQGKNSEARLQKRQSGHGWP